MKDFSTLIGGIAGDGINEAGMTVSRLLSRLGCHIYMYYDYPSLIRGGHNFSLIRASDKEISVHKDKLDILIALNQETIELHKGRLGDSSLIIYDQDKTKIDGLDQEGGAIPISDILKEEAALPIMRNTCVIGAFCKVTGIEWDILERIFEKHIPKQLETNLRVAKRGYDSATEHIRIEKLEGPPLPMLTGNQAIGLGLIKAGLQAYVAYPMTPSSGLLDFMAKSAPDFGLKVVHPESEIAVMLMSLGFAYEGVKTAVGTSGGGFCLMSEGLSLSGMAEMPAVIMLGQRTGPSTGLPTYTAQGDLLFALHAGQGEFPRFVVSPGDAKEAYYWAGVALNMAWKYQVPSFILSDKIVCEGLYSFDIAAAPPLTEEEAVLWDGNGVYNRYMYTKTGVSPLAVPPANSQIVKVDGYVHDQSGITSEDAKITAQMNEKRLLKEESMRNELESYEEVKAYGKGETALLFWGSNKGACIEAAQSLDLRAVQVLVLCPFPQKQLYRALYGAKRIITVECNSSGQLARLGRCYGFPLKEQILKYDGRPFSLDELESEIRKAIA
jgi:2-oxoglutarate ferredoxin oxidoreductase subunit alpha